MSRKKSNANIPLLAALVLLLLTMVSTHFTGGLLARYRSMSAGSDEARVAKFDVSATVAEVAEKNGEFTVTVTNKSEVAVSYEIVVTVDEPVDVTLKKGDTEISGSPAVSDGKKIVTFKHADWTLAVGAASDNYTLVFSVSTANADYITDTVNGENVASKESSFTVDVTATQID